MGREEEGVTSGEMPQHGEFPEGEAETEREMSAKLREQISFAQKLFDDRTVIQRIQKKARLPQYSSLHLLLGAVLLLVVVFVRRLPRFPGGKVAESVDEGDPLTFWEAKQIVGENPNEGLLKRLRAAEPHVAKGFHDFAQLSKESFDRREKCEQHIYNFQKQLVQALNPLIILTDRMASLLKQLPPQSETTPQNAEDLEAHLQLLSEVKVPASEQKAAFLGEWTAMRMKQDLYSDPEISNALGRMFSAEDAYMRRKIAMLDFQIRAAMKAKERGNSLPPTFQKELQSLEAKVQFAASKCEREAAACLDVLPQQDHWLVLLFVEHLPPRPARSTP